MNDGIGIIQNNHYKGHLSSSEILGLRWVQKNTVRAPLYLYNGEKLLGTIVFQNPKTKVIPNIADNKLFYTLNVKGKGSLIQMDQASTEEELKENAVIAIRKQITNTYKQGLKRNADVYRLSDALYRKDPKSWHNLSRNGGLKLDSNLLKKINIDVEIISAGKTKFKRKEKVNLD
ncbi:Ger(x)C family spore germination C-terminal domain-containing protein [Neobacillus pocheonensis]|uniref:Ger(X)C family spore germination C-terminal domain-containing protein n=1 Tax=Neobacillus pocheonensis TaxID=363869 RepID=A0ABT0WDZ0_9BACI|nr:Ger(x)C family spore germination C-terminal domain-containing protein [Neobacillus pocheonensis]